MRRLWAHIILAVATLAMVAGTFVNVFSNAKGNLEYSEGREVVFRITETEDTVLKEGETVAKKAAEVFEQRLKIAEVSMYSIETAGDDIVKVSLSQEGSNYDYVISYLSSFGQKALTNKSNSFGALTLKDIKTGDAYVETVNSVNPVINIPIDVTKVSGEKNLKDYAAATIEDENNKEVEAHEHEEGEEEGEEEAHYYLYLWYDYVEGRDTYEKTVSDNADFDQNVADRLSTVKFDAEEINEDTEYLKAYLSVDGDGDGNATEDEIKSAYKASYFMRNILNADALDYEIECIANSNTNLASAKVENLVNYGKLSWSKTLIATIVAVLIISLLLVVFYRLGALSVAVISILTAFAAAGLIVGFGAEFTTAGVVGVIIVTLASIVSGIIYLTKLKEDAYRGHTLKKANAEAAKKSLLPIIDIHFVVIVLGGILFLLGGSLFKTFAIATFIGGFISLVLNTLCLRGMMWLVTNTTGLIGRYDLFGIEKENVPNHLADEKQTFFGTYEKKDFTKKKKPVAIVGGSLFVVALTAMIVFGSLTKGYLFNTGNKALNEKASIVGEATEIYLEETKIKEEDSYKLTDVDINSLINDLLIYEDGVTDASKLKKFSTIVANRSADSTVYTTYEFSNKEDNVPGEEAKEVIYHKVSVIELTKSIDLDNFKVISSTAVGSSPLTVEEAFQNGMNTLTGDDVIEVSVKSTATYVSKNQPNWGMVMLGSFVALAVCTLYLCLRYRLSRGLTSILIPVVSSAIAIGVFSLLRVVAPTYMVVAIPLITAFTLFISIIFMNKERELVIEDKLHDASVGNRQAIMVRANSLAYSPILIFTIIAVYLAVNFFGFGPNATSTIYLAALIGMILSTLFVTTLYGPIAQLLYKWFAGMRSERKPRKNKTNKVVKKSNEPEEAIFIGIND